MTPWLGAENAVRYRALEIKLPLRFYLQDTTIVNISTILNGSAMKRVQLAKLIEWAGTLRTRKRMQKLIYMLQANGCPLGAGFTLHHYGPYSDDVASLTDEMTASGLLEEEEEANYVGRAFNYRLSAKGAKWLREMEKLPDVKRSLKHLERWKGIAEELNEHDVRELEVAATILAFKRRAKGRSPGSSL